MEQYLLSCPKGRPVCEIEADLGLPDPTETQAPATISILPYWWMKYFVDDRVVVCFYADTVDGGAKKPNFTYVGEPCVYTAEQYWRELEELTER